MRRSAKRTVGIVSGVLFCVALVVFLVLVLAEGGLDQGDKIASIVSMVIGGVTLLISVYALYVTRTQDSAVVSGSPPDRLDAVADAIAEAVRAQWEAEEEIRHVHDPFPLPFRWRNADDDMMDHWQNINGSPDDDTAVVLDGQGDHVVEAFRRVASGRLVVLGRAGAGKTILTSRFALTLLDERVREPRQPVPVIFSLGSWDPKASSLREWLIQQLVTNYPLLGQQDEDGDTLAARLLATRRILPVLDGLDEVTEGLRGEVITRINAGARPGDRFLLTSRPREYHEAVEASDVLTAAAVVQLERLTIDDLERYLPLTTRKVRGSRTKWHPVLEHMRSADGGTPLFTVFATPLMVSLARAIFSDTAADPAELLALDDSQAIEDRLLAGFLPAVYSSPAPRTGSDRAEHHLRFLAAHLRHMNSHDIAWWQFVRAVPRTVVGTVAGAVIMVAVWVGAGLAGWLGHWPEGSTGQRAWLIASLVAGVVCGIVGGVVVGQGRGIRPSPARIRLRVLGRTGQIARQLGRSMRGWRTMAWTLVWAGGGTVFGVVSSAFGEPGDVALVGLAAGLFAGLGTWFLVQFVRALGTPIDPTETISPDELLHTDRRTASRQGLVVGLGGAAVFWVMMLIAFEPAFGAPFEVVFGGGFWVFGYLATAALGGLVWMLFVTVWGPWMIARFWLTVTGRLPWPVMSFLADAHLRGVLRQAGGVYQFRHARLRDYLAA